MKNDCFSVTQISTVLFVLLSKEAFNRIVLGLKESNQHSIKTKFFLVPIKKSLTIFLFHKKNYIRIGSFS